MRSNSVSDSTHTNIKQKRPFVDLSKSSYAIAYLSFGNHFLKLKEYKKAIAFFLKSLEYKNREACIALSNLYSELGKENKSDY